MDGSERVSWCSQQDLNLRPWAYEAPALTATPWELVEDCKAAQYRRKADEEHANRYALILAHVTSLSSRARTFF